MNYNNYSTKQLLTLIDKSFYKNFSTKTDFIDFVNLFVEKFCQERNIVNAEIVIDDFANFTMSYCCFERIVYINSFYFKNYTQFVKNKNYYFLYSFFENLLHELRHHFQNNSTKINPIIKNYAILNYSLNYRQVLNNIEYKTTPLEIDSRYFAYQTLKDYQFFAPYFKMQTYMEEEQEMKFRGYHLVELIKDKNFKKIKRLSSSKEALENLVVKVAQKYHICFSGNEYKEDYLLNFALYKEIAPEFAEKEFYRKKLSDSKERSLEKEKNTFWDLFQEYNASL